MSASAQDQVVHAATLVAAELAKTSVFMEYVERRTASLGSASDFTSKMTKALKDQADKADGKSPFTAVFNTVSEDIYSADYIQSNLFCSFRSRTQVQVSPPRGLRNRKPSSNIS